MSPCLAFATAFTICMTPSTVLMVALTIFPSLQVSFENGIITAVTWVISPEMLLRNCLGNHILCTVILAL